jgi:hypothetical protein
MADEKHKIRNTVVASLTTAAITALVQYLVPGGWATVFAKVASIASGAIAWLGAPIVLSRWLFILLALLALILALVICIRIRAAIRNPDRSDYVEDEFEGLVWRWRYAFTGAIVELWCFCPECDSVLVYSEEGGSFVEERKPMVHLKCERCQTRRASLEGNREFVLARIQRLIDRKLRVGEWRAAVEHRRAKRQTA